MVRKSTNNQVEQVKNAPVGKEVRINNKGIIAPVPQSASGMRAA